MQKINILGVSIKDYSTKEALKLVDKYLNNGALNTLVMLSTDILLRAGENPEEKELLENMDMTICGEKEILEAAGCNNKGRIHDVETEAFRKEFFRKIVREKRTIFLIAETEDSLKRLKTSLYSAHSALKVVGEYAYMDKGENTDDLVNSLNDAACSVIVSNIPFPKQQQLMQENKQRINGDIWISFAECEKQMQKKRASFVSIFHYIKQKLFTRKVSRYNQNK